MTSLHARVLPHAPCADSIPASMAPERFSVLLPVYAGDHPASLARAFASVTVDQQRPPAEVVIVRDGPLSASLAAGLERLTNAPPVPVTVIELPENRGLARALEAGLAACRYDIVGRMDADDISLPERFAMQVPLVESGFEVVGSALAEMGKHEHDLRGIRRPPLTHAAISRSARFRSPFNHPTVVLRRSVVARVGGYEHLRFFEDYWLWVRMLAGGARAANLDQPLLLYRVDAGAYERRGGWRLVRPEIELQRRMRRIGFTSRAQFVRNVFVRGLWRLVPIRLRRALYGLVFRRGGSDTSVAEGV
jgi:glycosyltransferase involved in cell wall biosynthesis